MHQTEMSPDSREQPARKGIHRFCHVYRLQWYLCGLIAIAFAVVGMIELFDIANLRFIRMSNSFQFALLFAIFGMVSQIYYRLFEEKYDRKN